MRSTARVLSFEDLNTWHKCVATSPEYCDKIQNGLWVGCMDCAQQLWLQVASAKMAAMSSPGTFLKREMETIRLHPCKDAFQTFDLNTSSWFGYQWHSSHSFKMFPKLSAHFEASVITSYHGSLICWNDPTPCYDCQWLGLNLLWGVALLVHLDSLFLPRTETRQIWQSEWFCSYTSAGNQILHMLWTTRSPWILQVIMDWICKLLHVPPYPATTCRSSMLPIFPPGEQRGPPWRAPWIVERSTAVRRASKTKSPGVESSTRRPSTMTLAPLGTWFLAH